MSQLYLGFQALYMCSHSVDALERSVDCRTDMRSARGTRRLNRYSTWNRKMATLFSGHYLHNRSTLDIGVLGYIGVL